MLIRKSTIFILFILAAMLTTNMQCGECLDTTFQFSIPYTISPGSDSVRVGDTLWFDSKANFKLHDFNSNQDVSFRNARLGPSIGLADLHVPNTAIPAVPDFTFILIAGTELPVTDFYKDRARSLIYQIQGDTYHLRFGLVPKKAGVYALSVAGNSNISAEGYARCQVASINFPAAVDTHVYIQQNTYYLGQTVPPLEAANNYSFKVVD